jgi:hypothetical protein
MNVTDKFFEIYILLANNGLVSVLKKLPMPLMTSIECNCIPGQQSAHQLCNASGSAPQQKMAVVGHQCPRVTDCMRMGNQLLKPIKEAIPIMIIVENGPTFDPSNNNMMQNTRRV